MSCFCEYFLDLFANELIAAQFEVQFADRHSMEIGEIFSAGWLGGLTRRSRAVSVILLSVSLFGCGGESKPLSEGILGTWRTNAPGYEDRTFELRRDGLLFGTGRFGAPSFHSIVNSERIETDAERAAEHWHIEYRETDGAIGEVELIYRESPVSSLRFANRKEVWSRALGAGRKS